MIVLIQDTVIRYDRDRIAKIVRRAIERGKMREDLDVEIATDALHGSLLYRFLLTGRVLDALGGSYVEDPLKLLLAGLRSAP